MHMFKHLYKDDNNNNYFFFFIDISVCPVFHFTFGCFHVDTQAAHHGL